MVLSVTDWVAESVLVNENDVEDDREADSVSDCDRVLVAVSGIVTDKETLLVLVSGTVNVGDSESDAEYDMDADWVVEGESVNESDVDVVND